MTKDEALTLALEALIVSLPDLKGYWKIKAEDAITAAKQALAQPEQEPVRLRRGDILRCIETDELCTVWATSTTGKTLVKWNANNFGEYTAEQIGELFWLEPAPDDLELAAEKSDSYAAFHAGYRFAIAHSTAQPEHEPVAWGFQNTAITGRNRWMMLREEIPANDQYGGALWTPLYTTPPKRTWVGLTDEEIDTWNIVGHESLREFVRAIESKLKEKNT